MKRLNLILGIIGILATFGCTVEEPYPFTTKCSDENHGLSAVAYNNIICTPADVTGDKKADCAQFADSFKYGSCHLVSPLCIHDDENGTYMCSTSYCKLSQHEENGVCKDNDVNNCGGAKVRCSENMAGWLEGVCESDYSGVSCSATECAFGYKLNDDDKKCEKESACPEHEHITPEGACEPDDVENCGFYGNNCQTNITGWLDGQCEEGLCRLSACEDGYALEDGRCQPMIECQATEHIYITEDSNCEMDTVSNCGHHGNDCAWSDGWSDGTCIEGRCVASACQDGYDLKSGTCRFHVVSCEENQHLFNQECENNSIEHCGQHDYHCGQRIPGWNDGACVQGICEASGCLDGYRFDTSSKSCVALMTCDVHKHVLGNACVEDTVEACGSENNNCTRRAGWADGSCLDADCVATECAEGYEVDDGQCVAAKPEKQCTGCKSNEVCVDGKCVVTKCTQNCNTYNHAKSGVCSLDGKCIATSCASQYHLNKGSCERNTDTNCGNHGTRCNTDQNESCNATLGVCECKSGYTRYEGECKIEGYAPQCDENNYMTVTYQGKDIRAWCVKTVADLKLVKTGYPTDNADNAFVLVHDLEINDSNWSETDGGNNLENGYFWGESHTIVRKTCKGTVPSLFNKIDHSSVFDLNLEQQADCIFEQEYVGSLAYESTSSELNHIQFKGSLVGDQTVGGFVGKSVFTEYRDCSVDGMIESKNNIAGGMIGESFEALGAYAVSSIVRYCTVRGKVHGSIAGGIIGRDFESKIVETSFSGDIIAEQEAGGLVGVSYQNTHIVRTSVNGNVSGGVGVGGLMGRGRKYTQFDHNYFSGVVKGEHNVGGILGIAGDPDNPEMAYGSSFYYDGVFGSVEGKSTESSNIGGIFGIGVTSLSHSFSLADVKNAQSASLVGALIQNITITNTFTLGQMTNVVQEYDVYDAGKTVNTTGWVGSFYQPINNHSFDTIRLVDMTDEVIKKFEVPGRIFILYRDYLQDGELKSAVLVLSGFGYRSCQFITDEGEIVNYRLPMSSVIPEIDFCEDEYGYYLGSS